MVWCSGIVVTLFITFSDGLCQIAWKTTDHMK